MAPSRQDGGVDLREARVRALPDRVDDGGARGGALPDQGAGHGGAQGGLVPQGEATYLNVCMYAIKTKSVFPTNIIGDLTGIGEVI